MMKHFRSVCLSLMFSLTLVAQQSAFSTQHSAVQENSLVQEAVARSRQERSDANLPLRSFAISVSDHKMTDGPIPPDCSPPTAKFRFAATDAIAYQWTAASGANAGDVVRWDWIKPDGSPFRSDQLTFSVSGLVCFSAGLFIAGQPPASLPGDWKVNVLYNGTRILVENFTIGGDTARLCSKALQGFFDGVLRLGAAAVRSTCGQSGPLGAPLAALIVDDLKQTATGLELASPCIQFDVARVRNLQGRIGGMTGEQAGRELNQLIQDVQDAVRRAGLRSTQVGPNAFEGLTSAALSLGSAIARAGCSPCQDSVPLTVVNAINTDLSNAESSLRPYASCIPGFDFGQFRNQRVGAPAPAGQTSSDLIALGTALNLSICNSDCCFTCSGPAATGTVQGTVRNAANNQPISGATISVANTNLSTTSRSDGTYTLNNVPSGQQTLNASASGFIPAQVPVTVVANQTATRDINLTPVPVGGTVQGTVRNSANNQPIPGATISAANTSVTTTSGNDGSYTLANVPAGPQTLNASATGFTSAQVMVTVVANQTVTQNILLTPLPVGGTVQGTVRNASNGQPISGATIAVANTNLSTASRTDGTYALNNVPPGDQTLNASATGFISTQVRVTVVTNQTVTQNISLSPILTTGEIRITLNWTKDSTGAPDDLDMHLTGPNPDGASCFHIFFFDPGNLNSAPFAQLEVDNIELAGHPPTETIRISRLTPGTYRFFVHNFGGESADGISRSRATVQVFSGNALVFSATAPTGSGAFWNVFTLSGQTGAVTPVNQLTNTLPPLSSCR